MKHNENISEGTKLKTRKPKKDIIDTSTTSIYLIPAKAEPKNPVTVPVIRSMKLSVSVRKENTCKKLFYLLQMLIEKILSCQAK